MSQIIVRMKNEEGSTYHNSENFSIGETKMPSNSMYDLFFDVTDGS